MKFPRWTAGLTLIAFFASLFQSPMSYAAPDSVKPIGPQNVSLEAVMRVALPEQYGKMQETFSGKSGQMVVILQDAHSIPEAQARLRGLIDFFQKKSGIDLVALEGAEGPLDTQIFKSFPDQSRLKKVFKTYQEKGELSGGAAAAIFNKTPAVYAGMDDWNLYEQGISDYLEAARHSAEILKDLETVAANLAIEKKKHYPEKLLAADQALEKLLSHQGQGGFSEVLKALAAIQRPEAGSELALILEETERNAQAGKDFEAGIRTSAEAVLKKISASNNTARLTLFNSHYQDFKTSAAAPETFAAYLQTQAKDFNVPLSFSPELSRQIENQKKMQAIEGTQFFSKFETYAQTVKAVLIQNKEQALLDQATARLRWLQKMARLEMTFDDWKNFKAASQNSSDSAWTPAEKEILARMKVHQAFYQTAEKRDEVFLKNMSRLMQKHQRQAVIAVVGGFHAEGLMQQFREKGISYALVMPALKNVPEKSLYREHMQGNVSWKNYFRVKNGKVSLYDAFVRAVRDQLLKGQSLAEAGTVPALLREWHDQLIRDLVAKGRVTDLRKYSRFLEEVATEPEDPIMVQWKANIHNFVNGLRLLESKGALNEAGVQNLLRTTTSISLEAVVPFTHHAVSERVLGDGVSAPVARIAAEPVVPSQFPVLNSQRASKGVAASEVRNKPPIDQAAPEYLHYSETVNPKGTAAPIKLQIVIAHPTSVLYPSVRGQQKTVLRGVVLKALAKIAKNERLDMVNDGSPVELDVEYVLTKDALKTRLEAASSINLLVIDRGYMEVPEISPLLTTRTSSGTKLFKRISGDREAFTTQMRRALEIVWPGARSEVRHDPLTRPIMGLVAVVGGVLTVSGLFIGPVVTTQPAYWVAAVTTFSLIAALLKRPAQNIPPRRRSEIRAVTADGAIEQVMQKVSELQTQSESAGRKSVLIYFEEWRGGRGNSLSMVTKLLVQGGSLQNATNSARVALPPAFLSVDDARQLLLSALQIDPEWNEHWDNGYVVTDKAENGPFHSITISKIFDVVVSYTYDSGSGTTTNPHQMGVPVNVVGEGAEAIRQFVVRKLGGDQTVTIIPKELTRSEVRGGNRSLENVKQARRNLRLAAQRGRELAEKVRAEFIAQRFLPQKFPFTAGAQLNREGEATRGAGLLKKKPSFPGIPGDLSLRPVQDSLIPREPLGNPTPPDILRSPRAVGSGETFLAQLLDRNRMVLGGPLGLLGSLGLASSGGYDRTRAAEMLRGILSQLARAEVRAVATAESTAAINQLMEAILLADQRYGGDVDIPFLTEIAQVIRRISLNPQNVVKIVRSLSGDARSFYDQVPTAEILRSRESLSENIFRQIEAKLSRERPVIVRFIDITTADDRYDRGSHFDLDLGQDDLSLAGIQTAVSTGLKRVPWLKKAVFLFDDTGDDGEADLLDFFVLPSADSVRSEVRGGVGVNVAVRDEGIFVNEVSVLKPAEYFVGAFLNPRLKTVLAPLGVEVEGNVLSISMAEVVRNITSGDEFPKQPAIEGKLESDSVEESQRVLSTVLSARGAGNLLDREEIRAAFVQGDPQSFANALRDVMRQRAALEAAIIHQLGVSVEIQDGRLRVRVGQYDFDSGAIGVGETLPVRFSDRTAEIERFKIVLASLGITVSNGTVQIPIDQVVRFVVLKDIARLGLGDERALVVRAASTEWTAEVHPEHPTPFVVFSDAHKVLKGSAETLGVKEADGLLGLFGRVFLTAKFAQLPQIADKMHGEPSRNFPEWIDTGKWLLGERTGHLINRGPITVQFSSDDPQSFAAAIQDALVQRITLEAQLEEVLLAKSRSETRAPATIDEVKEFLDEQTHTAWYTEYRSGATGSLASRSKFIEEVKYVNGPFVGFIESQPGREGIDKDWILEQARYSKINPVGAPVEKFTEQDWEAMEKGYKIIRVGDRVIVKVKFGNGIIGMSFPASKTATEETLESLEPAVIATLKVVRPDLVVERERLLAEQERAIAELRSSVGQRIFIDAGLVFDADSLTQTALQFLERDLRKHKLARWNELKESGRATLAIRSALGQADKLTVELAVPSLTSAGNSDGFAWAVSFPKAAASANEFTNWFSRIFVQTAEQAAVFPHPLRLDNILKGHTRDEAGFWQSREFAPGESNVYAAFPADGRGVQKGRQVFEPIIDQIKAIVGNDNVQVNWNGPDQDHIMLAAIQEPKVFLSDIDQTTYTAMTPAEIFEISNGLEAVAAKIKPPKLVSLGYAVGVDGGLIEIFFDPTGKDSGEFLSLRRAIFDAATKVAPDKIKPRPSLVTRTVGRILEIKYSDDADIAASQKQAVLEVYQREMKRLRAEWKVDGSGDETVIDKVWFGRDGSWNHLDYTTFDQIPIGAAASRAKEVKVQVLDGQLRVRVPQYNFDSGAMDMQKALPVSFSDGTVTAEEFKIVLASFGVTVNDATIEVAIDQIVRRVVLNDIADFGVGRGQLVRTIATPTALNVGVNAREISFVTFPDAAQVLSQRAGVLQVPQSAGLTGLFGHVVLAAKFSALGLVNGKLKGNAAGNFPKWIDGIESLLADKAERLLSRGPITADFDSTKPQSFAIALQRVLVEKIALEAALTDALRRSEVRKSDEVRELARKIQLEQIQTADKDVVADLIPVLSKRGLAARALELLIERFKLPKAADSLPVSIFELLFKKLAPAEFPKNFNDLMGLSRSTAIMTVLLDSKTKKEVAVLLARPVRIKADVKEAPNYPGIAVLKNVISSRDSFGPDRKKALAVLSLIADGDSAKPRTKLNERAVLRAQEVQLELIQTGNEEVVGNLIPILLNRGLAAEALKILIERFKLARAADDLPSSILEPLFKRLAPREFPKNFNDLMGLSRSDVIVKVLLDSKTKEEVAVVLAKPVRKRAGQKTVTSYPGIDVLKGLLPPRTLNEGYREKALAVLNELARSEVRRAVFNDVTRSTAALLYPEAGRGSANVARAGEIARVFKQVKARRFEQAVLAQVDAFPTWAYDQVIDSFAATGRISFPVTIGASLPQSSQSETSPIFWQGFTDAINRGEINEFMTHTEDRAERFDAATEARLAALEIEQRHVLQLNQEHELKTPQAGVPMVVFDYRGAVNGMFRPLEITDMRRVARSPRTLRFLGFLTGRILKTQGDLLLTQPELGEQPEELREALQKALWLQGFSDLQLVAGGHPNSFSISAVAAGILLQRLMSERIDTAA